MRPAQCKSILIVEDDESIRYSLLEIVSELKYPTQAVSNGREALDVLGNLHKPCLVLLDLLMPEVDGFKFISAIKDLRENGEAHVIVITALSRPVEIDGVERVLKKPFGLEDLLDTVRYYLGY